MAGVGMWELIILGVLGLGCVGTLVVALVLALLIGGKDRRS
jgi:hypothetical protein